MAAGTLTQRDIRQAQAESTVFSTNTADHGAVEGENSSPEGYGVWGKNDTGVVGRGAGVLGTGADGVLGRGQIHGVAGVSLTRDNTYVGIGVYGQSEVGPGVAAISSATDRFGAVDGIALREGYGGRFQGGKAQLMLVPGQTAGVPTAGDHRKGEIYMDLAADLWVCVGDGAPGTWKKVTTYSPPPSR